MDGHIVFKGGKKTNWRDKKRLQLLLVTAGKSTDIYSKVCCCLDFFLVAVFFVSFAFLCLVCAVSIDSYKVGKCRIACCSCLSTGKETKHTHTHTHESYNFHSLKMHRAPTFNRNVFFFLLPPFFLWLFSSALGLETITAGRHTLFVLKAQWRWIWSAFPLVCSTIAPVRMSELLQCRAEVMKKQ